MSQWQCELKRNGRRKGKKKADTASGNKSPGRQSFEGYSKVEVDLVSKIQIAAWILAAVPRRRGAASFGAKLQFWWRP